jgi:hypothetical protein
MEKSRVGAGALRSEKQLSEQARGANCKSTREEKQRHRFGKVFLR